MVVNSINHREAERVCVYNKILQTTSAQTTSPSEEDINSFYNDTDAILGKPSHYMIVMGDINAQIGIRTTPMETATGTFGLEMKNEKDDTLVDWATSRKY